MLHEISEVTVEAINTIDEELDQDIDYTTNFWGPLFTPAALATANSVEAYHVIEETLTGTIGYLSADIADQILNETAAQKTPGNLRLNGTLPECPDDIAGSGMLNLKPNDSACQTTESLMITGDEEDPKKGVGQGCEERSFVEQLGSSAVFCPSLKSQPLSKARKSPKEKRLEMVLKRMSNKFRKYGQQVDEAFLIWSSMSNATLPWKMKIYEAMTAKGYTFNLLGRPVTRAIYISIIMLAEQRKFATPGISYFTSAKIIPDDDISRFNEVNEGHPAVWSYIPWHKGAMPDERTMKLDLLRTDNYSALAKSVNKTCGPTSSYYYLLLKLVNAGRK